MKKLCAFCIIILPYILIASIYCLATGFLMEELFFNNGYLLLVFIVCCSGVAFLTTIILVVIFIIKKTNPKVVAKYNLVLKILHIPAYIIVFVFACLCILSIWLLFIAILLAIFDLFLIFLTGIIGSIGVIRAYQEQKITKESSIKYIICQFIFCIDIIAAIKFYKRMQIVGITN